jgi:hypothetical protein
MATTQFSNSIREVATAFNTEAQIENDLSDSTLSPQGEDETICMPTAPAEEYVENILDFDDDELAPRTETTIESATVEVQSTTTQAPSASRLHDAKLGMAWSVEMMLTQSPDLASALHLHKVGDAVTVQVTVSGVTYDVCWTVATLTSEPSVSASAKDASTTASAPETLTRSSMKCKKGKFCKKGSACAFDHSTKFKLCIWVNTPNGCANGGGCEFSHECEGVKCSKGETRGTCVNGTRCAYKHGDDGAVDGVSNETQENTQTTQEKQEKQDGESTKENRDKEGEEKSDVVEQAAGKKRGHEDGEEDGRLKKQRLDYESAERGGKQFRDRGRGRGNGRGRGRGRGGGQGIRVRGTANKGAE